MRHARHSDLEGRRVLSIGSAFALLLRDPPADRDGRCAMAGTALGRALGRDDIVIGRRPSGRPRLAPPHPELGVSLSSRGSLLLVGFVPSGNVGVDVELDESTSAVDPAALAADHFSMGEAREIAALSLPAAQDLFLRLWVAKEAVLKLTGRGVVDGMRHPDCTRSIEALRIDGATANPSLPSTPAVQVAVRRVNRPGAGFAYCALASGGL
jgi:4'-phosphopantetheinyl transferase